jgi:predicted nuclease of predicted toxin-antitoxin system
VNLLFDQNLSFRLVRTLRNEFPGAVHVRSVGLTGRSDSLIVSFARQKDFAIVTLDRDFANIAAVRSDSPKVIWLRTGNSSTAFLASLLVASRDEILRFVDSSPDRLLVLGPLRLVEGSIE